MTSVPAARGSASGPASSFAGRSLVAGGRSLLTAALLAATVLTASPATASPVTASPAGASAVTPVTASSVAASSTSGHSAVTPYPGHLVGITRALEREARISGTAWWIDPPAGQVVVSHDDTVTGSDLARLASVARRFGDLVRTERMPGTLGTRISGGDPIYGGGSRCTLGFNVRDTAGTEYFVTAGHCTNLASSWYAGNGTYLGSVTASSFPGDDYGVVRYAGTVTRPGNVNLYDGSYQDITEYGYPVVGQRACISSPSAGHRCGYITALNLTVNYPGGTVYGLGRIDVCSEPGDSGAPVFQGSVAVGIVSGGSGNCTSGGVTYFQSIAEVMTRYGLDVY